MTSRNYERIFQFKVTLGGIRPPVWRRIQVPEIYTFQDLHMAIQGSMGWTDTHPHRFEIKNPLTGEREEIGRPAGDCAPAKTRPDSKKIADYFSKRNDRAQYFYDCVWEHRIRMEKVLPRKEGVIYPVCTGGEMACPPENCWGLWGYNELLDSIMSAAGDEAPAYTGGGFDPDDFDKCEVVFR